MMIRYKSRFLSRGEVWFDNDPGDTTGVDWLLYHQRSRPVPGARSRYFFTYLIDLTETVEQLQAHLRKQTAAKIRRARERDKIICQTCDARDRRVMDQYEEMYNTFAAVKGLVPLGRQRLENMAAAGLLDLSVARDAQGNALVYHATYRDSTRATSLETPSLYRTLSDSSARNLVGRANRYLMWSDIIRFKAQGLSAFDFGGWYYGNDPAMLNINEYKRGFGGQVVREYKCEQILTLKGRLLLAIAGVQRRALAFTAGRHHELERHGPDAATLTAKPETASLAPEPETAPLHPPEVAN